ncbi:uncharacterized protein [Mycetomoellerius zeteki]|uniref:uncharacterized protein n=1 Tax=Mycetomoellerius zeteki TaxID=64791 RepID=UPI00084E9589|nr:PREDICTED: uncharacterized protein LOC108731423 [Trachymyrmex zeteki]
MVTAKPTKISLMQIHMKKVVKKVVKKECINHVSKRMGSRLRKCKKNNKGLGGKGKLTDKVINDMSLYYSLAIRKNKDSVNDMHNAIWAILLYKSSTDTNPQHQNCPEGADSWCTWQKAKAEDKLQEYKHKPALPHNVIEAITPIFKNLTDKELLTRCLGAYTQNNNESFNNLIWKIAPKVLHSGVFIVKIAACLAVCRPFIIIANCGIVRNMHWTRNDKLCCKRGSATNCC